VPSSLATFCSSSSTTGMQNHWRECSAAPLWKQRNSAMSLSTHLPPEENNSLAQCWYQSFSISYPGLEERPLQRTSVSCVAERIPGDAPRALSKQDDGKEEQRS